VEKLDNDVAQSFINVLFHQKKNVKFIQVGVNDAKNSDFIRWRSTSFGWTGLLIEPHPTYFNMAKTAYQNYTKILWENVAISSEESTSDLFYVEDVPDDKPWAIGVASFDKSHLVKLGFEEHATAKVSCRMLPLRDLINKYGFYDIDLLVVDVEGHEFNVFKGIDFKNFSVRLVVVETEHMSREKFYEILELFPKNYRGYYSENSMDSIIYMPFS